MKTGKILQNDSFFVNFILLDSGWVAKRISFEPIETPQDRIRVKEKFLRVGVGWIVVWRLRAGACQGPLVG